MADKLFIFRLTRTDSIGYDETDAAVVVARNKAEAPKWAETARGDRSRTIRHAPTAKVGKIGTAAPGIEVGSVLESYNAG